MRTLFSFLLASLPTIATAASPSRSFHIEQTFAVPASPGAHQVVVWVPLPVDDPWQRITELRVDGARFEELHEVRYGDTAARVVLPASGGVVKLSYDVERWERSADLSRATGRAAPSGYARWLEPDARVPVDDRVRKIAQEVAGKAKTPLEAARAIYEYVLGTMRYEKPAGNPGWGQGDILWACDKRYGNCTDFHALFIGLLRAVGIPARFQIGYSIPEGAAADVPGYHCWADFYLDGVGWVPVDASEAWKHSERRDYFFGHHDVNRFAVSTGRDIAFSGMHGAALNYFVFPYAEADGKPIAEISRKTHYAPSSSL